MQRRSGSEILLTVYLWLFLIYLFLPLVVMGAATFNSSRFPTVTPWLGTTLKWFGELAADDRMWDGLISSLGVGIAVVVISVPVGLGAALLLTGLKGKSRTFVYGVMVSPLLTPGVIIGISTLVFWDRLGVGPGLHLATLGQCSFIIAYVMLMVLARLQRFDETLEEAGLDLGATHAQVFRRVLLPYLKPSLIAAAVLAFFQSFENYNTTLFTRGLDTTLTVYIASKVRTGLTPAVNALGLILISITILGAVGYEILRRREQARELSAKRRAAETERREAQLA
ncbi:ABC transporter permease [Dongia soli]|uniref:ABC transporter permease n=1 Tax=Dongia soli TaxID=600628 RepID=A0ABU5EFL4_9PROT|nr:ABC transporter permease [Dongia soli]MDY0885008.1 ABC transporter permease [Dongia soli]